MEKIAGMTSMQAAVYVSSEIVPKSQTLKPETTKTPAPLDIPEGKGAPEHDPNEKYMTGGQFV
jgi:hypothetical protein